MKRPFKATEVFYEYWKENKAIIEKKEFDAIWGVDSKKSRHYYYAKKQFLSWLEEQGEIVNVVQGTN